MFQQERMQGVIPVACKNKLEGFQSSRTNKAKYHIYFQSTGINKSPYSLFHCLPTKTEPKTHTVHYSFGDARIISPSHYPLTEVEVEVEAGRASCRPGLPTSSFRAQEPTPRTEHAISSASGSRSRRRSAGVSWAGSMTATESGGHGIGRGGGGLERNWAKSQRGERTVVFFSSFSTVGPML